MKRFIKPILLLAICLMALFTTPEVAAQGLNTGTALNDPQTDSGVVDGLNEILQFVFLFLKFLAIVACGWGSYQMWKGEFSSGIWAYIAALALFFSPALVNLAQDIGRNANS